MSSFSEEESENRLRRCLVKDFLKSIAAQLMAPNDLVRLTQEK